MGRHKHADVDAVGITVADERDTKKQQRRKKKRSSEYSHLRLPMSSPELRAVPAEQHIEEEMSIMDKWEQYTAPDGRPYYYNAKTKESRWKLPKALRVKSAEESALKSTSEIKKSTASTPDITTPTTDTISTSNSARSGPQKSEVFQRLQSSLAGKLQHSILAGSGMPGQPRSLPRRSSSGTDAPPSSAPAVLLGDLLGGANGRSEQPQEEDEYAAETANMTAVERLRFLRRKRQEAMLAKEKSVHTDDFMREFEQNMKKNETKFIKSNEDKKQKMRHEELEKQEQERKLRQLEEQQQQREKEEKQAWEEQERKREREREEQLALERKREEQRKKQQAYEKECEKERKKQEQLEHKQEEERRKKVELEQPRKHEREKEDQGRQKEQEHLEKGAHESKEQRYDGMQVVEAEAASERESEESKDINQTQVVRTETVVVSKAEETKREPHKHKHRKHLIDVEDNAELAESKEDQVNTIDGEESTSKSQRKHTKQIVPQDSVEKSEQIGQTKEIMGSTSDDIFASASPNETNGLKHGIEDEERTQRKRERRERRRLEKLEAAIEAQRLDDGEKASERESNSRHRRKSGEDHERSERRRDGAEEEYESQHQRHHYYQHTDSYSTAYPYPHPPREPCSCHPYPPMIPPPPPPSYYYYPYIQAPAPTLLPAYSSVPMMLPPSSGGIMSNTAMIPYASGPPSGYGYSFPGQAQPPPVMVRCKGCKGFGVDLVEKNGYCKHCNRLRLDFIVSSARMRQRCAVCGGWGLGLVQTNGKCNHCTRQVLDATNSLTKSAREAAGARVVTPPAGGVFVLGNSPPTGTSHAASVPSTTKRSEFLGDIEWDHSSSDGSDWDM